LDLNIVRKIVKVEPTKTQIAKKEPKKGELTLSKLYQEGILTKEEFLKAEAKVSGIEKQSQKKQKAKKKIFRIGNVKTSKLDEEKCIPEEKSGFKKIDGKRKYVKKKICISMQDIAELGIYQEFNDYPEGMLKEFKQCKKFICQSEIASRKMYVIFVQRTPVYHARHPEKMIHGMAWYEIFYLSKLKKTMRAIERYVEYKQGNYNYKSKMSKGRDESEIDSLIKMNKGRKNMRKAMGLSLEDDLAKVLKRHWLLGDFLGNDQVKVKKAKINPEIKKRKELLIKYQAALKKYQNKLEEEKNKKGL
jgi:hypothetical protein